MARNKINIRATSGTTAFHRVPDVKKIPFEKYEFDLDDLYNSHYILYRRKYYSKRSNHDKKETAMVKTPVKVLKLPTHVIDL